MANRIPGNPEIADATIVAPLVRGTLHDGRYAIERTYDFDGLEMFAVVDRLDPTTDGIKARAYPLPGRPVDMESLRQYCDELNAAFFSANAAVTFGQRLHYWRTRRALTQRELAQSVGVDERHISSWEHGHSRPYPQNRRKLAEALGVTPDDLMP